MIRDTVMRFLAALEVKLANRKKEDLTLASDWIAKKWWPATAFLSLPCASGHLPRPHYKIKA